MRPRFKRFANGLIVASIGVGITSFAIGDAQASAAKCRALKTELASLSGGSGNTSKYQRYDSALKRQNSELSKAQRMARSSGCNRSNSSQCRGIKRTISKMQANAAKLKRTRDRFASRKGSTVKRNWLISRIKSLRCDSRSVVEVRAKKPSSRSVISSRGKKPAALKPVAPTIAGGGYRMMCVRLSDGYFFPIAFETAKPDFKRTTQACQALCPGAETRAFAHRLPEQETEDMVDAKGAKYTEMQNAFAYLNRSAVKAPTARCNYSGAQAEKTDEPAALQGPVPVYVLDNSKVTLPSFRPDLYADPETSTNKSQGLTIEMVKRLMRSVQTSDELQMVNVADEQIRVVVPNFLPDPATAIDLQSQAPTSVQ